MVNETLCSTTIRRMFLLFLPLALLRMFCGCIQNSTDRLDKKVRLTEVIPFFFC